MASRFRQWEIYCCSIHQKAFDSVSHDILLNKLSAFGISGLLYEYIHSYLRNTSQYTVLNRVKSEKKSVRFGVPQGSILGPNLFSVFVNDMPQVVKKDGDLELFADDTTAVEFGNSIDEAVSKIKKTTSGIEDYTNANKLSIHPKKCKVLIISKRRFIGPLQEITINSQPVEVVAHCKCLGIHIDQNLSWHQHVIETCKSFSAKLKKLYRMRACPNQLWKPYINKVFCLPFYMGYCCGVIAQTFLTLTLFILEQPGS
ncbi:MAG: reverse transcriptase domain-containing protein [Cyanobacteria bacterium J06649_11]